MTQATTAPSPLGFVGLGVMGAAMAGHLIAGGNQVYVYDVRSEAIDQLVALGAIGCGSPAEVAQHAAIVFVSLPSPDLVLEVLAGAGGLLEGEVMRTFVDLSTSGTEMAATALELLDERDVGYVDAPVSGGPQGARNARLTVMAASAKDLFDEVAPLLSLLGTNVLHVGETPGQGQLTKVINNQLSATAMAATGEALALGVKGGLDPERLLAAINLSSGRNTASEDKYPRCVITRTFDYGFRLRLMAKDTALCMSEAARLDFAMPLGAAVRDAWAEADAKGSDTDDFTTIAKLYEQRANVTIGGTAAS
jgi:3-hydroxyisobutyrate dehydrogenase-like beta-hydroxyacid dehydrogenase